MRGALGLDSVASIGGMREEDMRIQALLIHLIAGFPVPTEPGAAGAGLPPAVACGVRRVPLRMYRSLVRNDDDSPLAFRLAPWLDALWFAAAPAPRALEVLPALLLPMPVPLSAASLSVPAVLLAAGCADMSSMTIGSSRQQTFQVTRRWKRAPGSDARPAEREPACRARPASREAGLARRVVSVGDLHGDFVQTRLILRELGLMPRKKGEWTGGDTVLVQTGDVVDSGGDESGPIFEALFRLQDQAPAAGGEVILLLGNHELMNLEGDFRYATPGDTPVPSSALGVPAGDRARAFGPAGWVGARLRERGRAVALVGPERGLQRSVLFVHAGVLPEIAEAAGGSSGRGLEEALNRALGKAISGDADSIRFSNSVLLSNDGPFWTRRLALGSTQGARGACAELQRSLDAFGAARMVVGHTAQADGRVHHRCDGRLILGDTLISAAYTGTPHPSAVEYLPDGSAFALYPGTGGRSALPTPQAGAGAEDA
ncbi:unnamed protein product [Prorocentrum cordatum]|uniref:Calcineurin-like phosphoesterase domain-containing protein n=1 Tax=Prorocentrum cordatum TaxID=2364126 RepID=A0ABN9TAR9_9DINO|nr:unnamed protein product [Polarella glacialis]